MDEKYVIDGYVFETERQANQARRELEGIRYTKSKLEMDNPEAVLMVYNRILKEKMFSTPIGYNFLRELQEYLLASPVIRRRDIHPIDFSPVIEQAKRDDEEAIRIQKVKAKERYKAKEQLRKQRERHKKRDEKNFNDVNYKRKYQNSLLINVALVVVIIGMFLLVRFSDIPTILDYEDKLINRYEEWEQQLEKREQKIEQYEEQYHITEGYQ